MSGLDQKMIEVFGSPLAKRVELHEDIYSTQDRARVLAHEGAPHGTLVVAKAQQGGRGRLGRRWGSPSGGLWISLVLRPGLPARFAPRITQTAAVGVAKALRDFGVEARIKWPNDLLVGERKLSGILAQSGIGNVRGPEKPVGPGAGHLPGYFVVLGIGINANLDPEDLEVVGREVATLRSELGRDVDLTELLGALLRSLEAELEKIEDFDGVLEDWRALNCTLGRMVRVERSGEVLVGQATGLTPEGALLLETPEGIVELFEGEVEHLRQEGA